MISPYPDRVGRGSSQEPLSLDELVGEVVDYAIIALDPQGVIVTWNLGAERTKGYTASEAIGRNFSMFYTEEDRQAGLPSRLLGQARESGRVEHTGWRVRKDGTRFWGDVVITARHREGGELSGYVKVTRDRTELKEREAAQDAFYAAFNHDFRTPLTAIKGFVELLRDATPEERESLIDRAESSTDRLLVMVEGLVQFARQRADHAVLVLGDIDVGQVARSAAQDLPPELAASRVLVADDVAMARADGVAMHRVVTNLLVNALKYSVPSSTVEVTFSVPQPEWVRLTVADQGRGIDPGDLDSIFDEFARGRLAQDDGGTGLGLASVRALVEDQQGHLAIESELGVGTRVHVDLPMWRLRKPNAPAQRSAASSPSSMPTGQAGG